MRSVQSTPESAQRQMHEQLEVLVKRIHRMSKSARLGDLMLLFHAACVLEEDSREPVALVYLSGLGLR